MPHLELKYGSSWRRLFCIAYNCERMFVASLPDSWVGHDESTTAMPSGDKSQWVPLSVFVRVPINIERKNLQYPSRRRRSSNCLMHICIQTCRSYEAGPGCGGTDDRCQSLNSTAVESHCSGQRWRWVNSDKKAPCSGQLAASQHLGQEQQNDPGRHQGAVRLSQHRNHNGTNRCPYRVCAA